MGNHKSALSIREAFAGSLSLLQFERREILYVIVYTIFVGIAGLSSTVSIQFLVNQLAFTGQAFPVILLSVLTVAIMGFSVVLQIMRMIVVELIQRRVMVRASFGAVDSLSNAGLERKDWTRREIVHRFFDVMNYQKAMASIILEGLGVAIVTVLGVLVVALYHPLFAAFTLIIIGFFAFIVFYFLRRALETNYEQSSQKYRIASWLSSVADGRSLFWSSRGHGFILDQTDVETSEYLRRRHEHFVTLMWQQGSLYVLQAVGAGLLLGVGGTLVVLGQINLGQLVAAESILMTTLYGLASFGKTLENSYDLVTASQKLEPLLDAGSERTNEGVVDDFVIPSGPSIEFHSKSAGIEARLALGEVVGLRGVDGEARRQLLWNLAGLETSGGWDVSIGGTRIGVLSERWRRDHILFIDRPAVFDVDLKSNLCLSGEGLESTKDTDLLQRLPLLADSGLKIESTNPASEWANDPRIRLHVALVRAFFSKADIILIDSLFSDLSRAQKQEFLERFQRHCPRKLLVINCDADLDLPAWTKVVAWT